MMPSCLGWAASQINCNDLFNPMESHTLFMGILPMALHGTDDEQEFNTRMSKVRTCVEWGFGKICQNVAYLDFKKNLNILLQPVGKFYLVACILINCHTCLYGSQTTTYFNLEPPSLETYLSNQWLCLLDLSTYNYFIYVNNNRSEHKLRWKGVSKVWIWSRRKCLCCKCFKSNLRQNDLFFQLFSKHGKQKLPFFSFILILLFLKIQLHLSHFQLFLLQFCLLFVLFW